MISLTFFPTKAIRAVYQLKPYFYYAYCKVKYLCLFVFKSDDHSIQSILTQETEHAIESPTNLRLLICENYKVNLIKMKYI